MRVTVTPGAAGSISAAPRAPRSWAGSGTPPTNLGFPGDEYLRSNGDYYRRTSAGWGSPLFSLRGPIGETGSEGPMGTPLTGTAVPSNDDGEDGQVYFRTYSDGAARSYYIKAAGAWGPPHDMRGPPRAPVTIGRTITGNTTLADSDLGKLLIVDAASDVTISLPDTLELGFNCMVIWGENTGQPIFDPIGTATLLHPYDHDRIGVQLGVVSLVLALSATKWSLMGETAAA